MRSSSETTIGASRRRGLGGPSMVGSRPESDLAIKWLTPMSHERGRRQLRVPGDGVIAQAYPRRSAVVGVAEEVVPLPGEGRLGPRIEVTWRQRGPARRSLHLVAPDPSSQLDQGVSGCRALGVVGGEQIGPGVVLAAEAFEAKRVLQRLGRAAAGVRAADGACVA